ncbi:mitofilin family membrane protein [Oricola sp.]|uniref:mitofilin family membrane protein n=1 Tax=Oricola sp. TaxID=1979950 RepID=UPI003BAAD0A7
MAQNPKSRRRPSSRKPVTLDLKAEPAKPEATADKPDAEPVAFGRSGEQPKPKPESKAESKPETKTKAAPKSAPPAGDAKPEAADAKPSPERAADSGPATAAPSPARGPGFGTLAASGVFGGVVAVLIAGGLQWVGVLPPLQTGTSAQSDALQTRIDALESRVAALPETGGDASATEGLAGRMNAIDAAVAEASRSVAALQSSREAVDQRLASIDAVLAAGGGEGGGDPAALGDLTQRLAALEEAAGAADPTAAVAEISTSLDALASAGEGRDEALAAVSGKLDETTAAMSGIRDEAMAAAAALDERLARVEADIDAGAGSRVAGAIAASALKSASDRGLPFMSELESYASVAGQSEAVDALRDYAASGVPTLAQLVDRFPPVANRIVASASGVGEDAGIGERLMASARSLVQVRPVGEVPGDEPGAIAARIEVALQRSDLARAIAEWESLPDAARTVSEGFATDLKARQRLDSLISDVLSGAMDSAPAGDNG